MSFQSPSRRKAIATWRVGCETCKVCFQSPSRRKAIATQVVSRGLKKVLASNHLPAERRLRPAGGGNVKHKLDFQSPSRRKAIATGRSNCFVIVSVFQSPSRRKAIATPPSCHRSSSLPFQSPSRRKAIATCAHKYGRNTGTFQSPSRRKAIATGTAPTSRRLEALPITFPPKGDCDLRFCKTFAAADPSNHLPAERRLRHRRT